MSLYDLLTNSYNRNTNNNNTTGDNPFVWPDITIPNLPNISEFSPLQVGQFSGSSNENTPTSNFVPGADIYADYANYFNTSQPGDVRDWAGGTLTMNPGGYATYLDPAGQSMNLYANTPLADLYTNPYIADLFNQTYGMTTMQDMFGAPTTQETNTNIFDVPLSLFPYTTSTSGSQTSGSSSSSGQATSKEISSAKGAAQSGINWGTPFMQMLAPKLTASVEQLAPTISNMKDTLQSQYANLMKQALGPEAFQGTLNNLASRNVLRGTIAENALSNTAKNIIRDIANKGYESMLAQQSAQLALPNILGTLAGLGKESASITESNALKDAISKSLSASRNMGTSTGVTQTADPLAPYKLIADLLMF